MNEFKNIAITTLVLINLFSGVSNYFILNMNNALGNNMFLYSNVTYLSMTASNVFNNTGALLESPKLENSDGFFRTTERIVMGLPVMVRDIMDSVNAPSGLTEIVFRALEGVFVYIYWLFFMDLLRYVL